MIPRRISPRVVPRVIPAITPAASEAKYTWGGSLVKWYRDAFARRERDLAAEKGQKVYELLLAEMPPRPGRIVVLPRFAPIRPA